MSDRVWITGSSIAFADDTENRSDTGQILAAIAAECAVIGAPDEIRGEVVEAFVVRRAGATGPTDEDALTAELQALVKTDYAAHAFPRRVHFVEALPKTPSGKIQRRVLREQRRAAGAG